MGNQRITDTLFDYIHDAAFIFSFFTTKRVRFISFLMIGYLDISVHQLFFMNYYR